jgi:predicted GNAT superfamily acetyltransferase
MIELRALTESRQFQEAVDLQKTVWGFNDMELLPVRLFVVATKVGGQAFGAYNGNGMVGFLLSIPGLKPGGGSYLHSHMLGVLAEYRNQGVGRMLKLRQREDALQRGIGLIEWTFDPLELKNAFFNMERLGAIVRRYVENQYGTTTSPLHGGLPTDRCVAGQSPRRGGSGGAHARAQCGRAHRSSGQYRYHPPRRAPARPRNPEVAWRPPDRRIRPRPGGRRV